MCLAGRRARSASDRLGAHGARGGGAAPRAASAAAVPLLPRNPSEGRLGPPGSLAAARRCAATASGPRGPWWGHPRRQSARLALGWEDSLS